MNKTDLKDKKIIIVGAGREGLATLSYLKNLYPANELAIADKSKNIKILEQGIKVLSGPDYLNTADKYDLIIKSPGVPSSALSKIKAPITSSTQIFFDECQGTIIGITGTKGKSTTASLIYKILKDAGQKVELVGNIGKPAISYLRDDSKDKIYVSELSSFQLEKLTKSPHIAVFLNVFEDHLDVHENVQAYKDAKLNIAKWQNEKDFLIYNEDFEEILKNVSSAKKIPFTKNRNLLKPKDNPLIGEFNLNNIAAAVTVAKLYKIRDAEIVASIRTFKPLKHRLQDIGTFGGITFFNDSIATNPTATMAALDSLKGKLQTLILGGYDRGLNFNSLAQKIVENKVEILILLPVTGKKILDAIKNMYPQYHQKYFAAKNLREAVGLAFKHTQQGRICLLSPASASFNQFKNYEDRGEQFIALVKALKQNGRA